MDLVISMEDCFADYQKRKKIVDSCLLKNLKNIGKKKVNIFLRKNKNAETEAPKCQEKNYLKMIL